MGAKRRIIFVATLLAAAVILFVGWRRYGGGWKRLTPDPATWNVIMHDSGMTAELSTFFTLDNIDQLGDVAVTCDGRTSIRVLINHVPVTELNGFNIHPTGQGDELLIQAYYDQVRHIMDSTVRKHMREGENSLRLFVRADGKVPEFGNWGLDAEIRGIHFSLPRAPEPHGKKWTPASQIPVIRLTVPGNVIPDEPKVEALLEFEGADFLIENQRIRIEARGRSSIGYDQKSFSLRCVNASGKPTEVNFPGLDANSGFILYAPQMDLSLIRNALAYELFSQMGHFSPKLIPVELIVNDHYRGVYYLMQKVDVSMERVALRYDPGDTGNTRNNAFLVEINPATSDDEVLYTSYWNYLIHPPGTPDIPDGDYRKIIAGQLDIMVSSVYQNLDVLDQVIDFRSFADFIILQECSKNIDAYRLSTYFHKTHEDDDKLIHAGPVWDFNLAFGLSDEMNGREAEGWIHREHAVVDTFWTRLAEHPGFSAYLKKRYAELRGGLLSDGSLNAITDSLIRNLDPVRERQFTRYPWPTIAAWPYSEIAPDYLAETTAIKEFMRRRLAWMDKELELR